MNKPFYKHDCSNCIFLGSYRYDKTDYDLYYCSNEPTIIARYGENGEYLSGITFGLGDLTENHSNSPLAVALKRGYKKGLIGIKVYKINS